MSNAKEARITIRVNTKLYEFLRDFSAANELTISELIRHVVIYWHMALLLHQLTPYKQLEKDFFELAKTKFTRK
jgi:hypothetical protein